MPPPCHATETNMLPTGGVSSTIGEDQGGQPGPRRGGRGRLVYRGEDGEGSGLFKDSRLVGQPCTVIAAPAARSSSISWLRTLVAKVKAYCERFKTVLVRTGRALFCLQPFQRSKYSGGISFLQCLQGLSVRLQPVGIFCPDVRHRQGEAR